MLHNVMQSSPCSYEIFPPHYSVHEVWNSQVSFQIGGCKNKQSRGLQLFSMDAKFELMVSPVGCKEQLTLKIRKRVL